MQRILIPLGLIVFGSSVCASTALAGPQPVIPACAYQDIDVKKYGYAPFQNPPDIHSKGGVLDTRLNAQYTDPATVSIAGGKNAGLLALRILGATDQTIAEKLELFRESQIEAVAEMNRGLEE